MSLLVPTRVIINNTLYGFVLVFMRGAGWDGMGGSGVVVRNEGNLRRRLIRTEVVIKF